jgi:signal-transduction protein with cAMP-binding, CBS, and nucleotidyltransferase domain
MLSIDRVKELLKDSNISDEEAKEIRDSFRSLAEIIFEQWRRKRKKECKSGKHLHKFDNSCYDGE